MKRVVTAWNDELFMKGGEEPKKKPRAVKKLNENAYHLILGSTYTT